MGLLLVGCQPKSYPSYLQIAETTLANPIISVDSVLFRKEAIFRILPTEATAQIRYSTNGEEVTLENPLCSDSLIFMDNVDVKFKAFHPDFLPSEMVSFSVRKIGNDGEMKILEGSTSPKAPYVGKGIAALSDMEKGLLSFRENHAWLGFQNEVVEFHLEFEKATYCEQLSLSILTDVGSWIFPPAKIELLLNNLVVAEKVFDVPLENEKAAFRFLDLRVGASLKEATLKIYMDTIPDWHAGKGTMPWFFVDEVFNVSMSE